MKTKDLVTTALFAALICVAAPFSISVGPVPITLATFAVYLSAAIIGRKRAVVAVIIYILLGAVGLPVFSGFAGGFHKLVGPTGGYIVGYIACAYLTGLLVDKLKAVWSYPLGMVLGTAGCYLLGTIWYCLQTSTHFIAALSVCVVPFLLADGIKIVVSSLIAIGVKKALPNRI